MSPLEVLLSWIQDPSIIITTGGYLGIALAVFAESGVLVGLFLPGDSLLFAAGILAAADLLSIWYVVPLVVAAAFVGDSVGYWFGRRVGTALFTRADSRFFKQEYVRRTQDFYATYGGRAIVFARFVPIVRTMAPVLAGVAHMAYPQFIRYNVIGALAWGAGVTLLGYFLGSLVPQVEHYLLPISLLIILASFAPMMLHLRPTFKTQP